MIKKKYPLSTPEERAKTQRIMAMRAGEQSVKDIAAQLNMSEAAVYKRIRMMKNGRGR